MTQEDKQLLLKDISARLPYGVKCCIYNFGEDTVRIKEDVLWSVQGDNILTLKSYIEKGEAYMYHQIRPYLFPLSSMTEEQKEELKQEHIKDEKLYAECLTMAAKGDSSMRGKVIIHYAMDWCNKNHFDFRGLIPLGLAIDATGLNIY